MSAFQTQPSRIAEFGLTRMTELDEARRERLSGPQLSAFRRAAPRFKDAVRASGRVDFVRTCPLQKLPYPAQFGFFRARTLATPFLTITNRMIVVRFREGGRTKTLLWEPSDVELGIGTPFFANLAKRVPDGIQKTLYERHSTVLDALAAVGVAPADVDYLVFDHLHTQDVRRLIGTTKPQSDISPNQPVTPWFPNAKLIVQKAELDLLADIHPLQRPWFQPWTYDAIRPEGLLVIEGDYRVGAGVALLATPGHTPGNQSLVLNTSTGLWVSSENVVAVECLNPEHSRITGLASWTKESGEELVMNGNTLETRAEQYNSTVLEKLVADPDAKDPRFVQFFPSSELTASFTNPFAGPTFVHGAITEG